MSATVSLQAILPLREQLDQHPVYAAVQSLKELQRFMSRHIFSVWDFMSLLKYLQGTLAPVTQPWAPSGDPTVRRFINDIVLEEESDLGLPDAEGNTTYASHFELYGQAMEEVGASSKHAMAFARDAANEGLSTALKDHDTALPEAAKRFMQQTFAFIDTGKPHVVAAAFALGREHIIPPMFRSLLKEMAITKEQAPAFHYYLERHIHLDEDHHGPLSMRMLNLLCAGDQQRIEEAEATACKALQARIEFWDGVLTAL